MNFKISTRAFILRISFRMDGGEERIAAERYSYTLDLSITLIRRWISSEKVSCNRISLVILHTRVRHGTHDHMWCNRYTQIHIAWRWTFRCWSCSSLYYCMYFIRGPNLIRYRRAHTQVLCVSHQLVKSYRCSMCSKKYVCVCVYVFSSSLDYHFSKNQVNYHSLTMRLLLLLLYCTWHVLFLLL